VRKEVAQVDRVWSAITDTCTDLLRKGIDVSEAVSTLREIRALINLYETHDSPNPCCTDETGARIRCELRNLEDMVVIKAANELGMDYATELSNKLMRAWKPKILTVMKQPQTLGQAQEFPRKPKMLTVMKEVRKK